MSKRELYESIALMNETEGTNYCIRSGYGKVGLDDGNRCNLTGFMSTRELSLVIQGMWLVFDSQHAHARQD